MKLLMKPLLALTPAALMLMASCGGADKSAEVKDFAVNFAQNAAANHIDSLLAVYPGIAKADSVALTFTADSITVTPQADADGKYTVTFGNGAEISVTRAEDGKITVDSSRGLFAYPASEMEFARTTGMYAPGLDDAALAGRMADTLFINSFAQNAAAEIKKQLTASNFVMTKQPMFGMDEGNQRCTVSNNADYQIDGSDYTLQYHWSYMHMGFEDSGFSSEKGKDVPAKGKVKFDVACSGHGGVDSKAGKIIWKLSDDELVKKYYKPTGKEYDEYLAGKSDKK